MEFSWRTANVYKVLMLTDGDTGFSLYQKNLIFPNTLGLSPGSKTAASPSSKKILASESPKSLLSTPWVNVTPCPTYTLFLPEGTLLKNPLVGIDLNALSKSGLNTPGRTSNQSVEVTLSKANLAVSSHRQKLLE
jgi:hypothetical protein